MFAWFPRGGVKPKTNPGFGFFQTWWKGAELWFCRSFPFTSQQEELTGFEKPVPRPPSPQFEPSASTAVTRGQKDSPESWQPRYLLLKISSPKTQKLSGATQPKERGSGFGLSRAGSGGWLTPPSSSAAKVYSALWDCKVAPEVGFIFYFSGMKKTKFTSPSAFPERV